MMVNNIILAILLGLTSDVQGVMNIKSDALHDMVQLVISNNTENSSSQSRLSRRNLPDQEMNVLLAPLFGKTRDMSKFFNGITNHFKTKYSTPSGGMDPIVSNFMCQINKAVNDPKFNVKDVNSKNNIMNLLNQADNAYIKNKSKKESSLKPSTSKPLATKSSPSGNDPRNLSLGSAGTTTTTITTTKTNIDIRIKIERITKIIISIKSVDKETLTAQIFSLIQTEFLSGEDKQYQVSLTPYINRVLDTLKDSSFQPGVREHQMRLIDEFQKLAKFYEELHNISSGNDANDKVINKEEAAAKTMSFITKSYGGEDGSYAQAYVVFIDLLSKILNSQEYDPNDTETKAKTKSYLVQLDNIKKAATKFEISRPRFTHIGKEFLTKLITNTMSNEELNEETAKLLRTFIVPKGGFNTAVAPHVREFKAVLKYKESNINEDEAMRNKIAKSVYEIEFAYSQTDEGRKLLAVPKKEPEPSFESQTLRDISKSFDNYDSCDLPIMRSRIKSFTEDIRGKSESNNPEIEESIKAIEEVLDSVSPDFEDVVTTRSIKKRLRKLELDSDELSLDSIGILEKSNESSNGLSGDPASLSLDASISNDQEKDLEKARKLFDSTTNENKKLFIEYITKYLAHYYANQDDDFSLVLFSQNQKIQSFLSSADFKSGSKTWEELEELLKGMDDLSSEESNSGPFIAPELTSDRNKNNEEFLIALRAVNSSNKQQALDFVEVLILNQYGQENGGLSISVSERKVELMQLIEDPDFEDDLDMSIMIVEQILNMLNKQMSISQGTSQTTVAPENFRMTGDYYADRELVLGIAMTNIPSQRDKVLKLFKEFCDYHLSSGINSAMKTEAINSVIGAINDPEFNPRDSEHADALIFMLNELEIYKSKNQEVEFEPSPIESEEETTIPDILGVFELDQQNFYTAIRVITRDETEYFVPYMNEYFATYYSDKESKLPKEIEVNVKELEAQFNDKDFDPSEPDNRQKIDATLAKIEQVHAHLQELANSSSAPFKSPNFTNNKAQDMKLLLKSLNSATDANKNELANIISKYLKVSYADKNGKFTGGVDDIVIQINTFLNSKQFSPKDQASRERILKWINEIDIVDSSIKNPGAIFGFYKYPELSNDRVESKARLIKSLDTVSIFNKDEAVGAISTFVQKFYSNNNVMHPSLVTILHKMTSYVQSSSFSKDNPKNKSIMEELLDDMHTEYESVKDTKSTLTPYKKPEFVEDMGKNIQLLADSMKSVNRGNTNDFENTVIVFLRQKFVNVYGKEKPLTFSKVQQLIQLIQSEGFNASSQTSVDQFINLLTQLKDYTSKKALDSSNLFPLEKFSYDMDQDLKQLVQILQNIPLSSDASYFVNPTTQYLSVYFADSNGIFPYQLTKSIQNILSYVKNNVPNAKTQKFYDSLKLMISKLDNECFIIKHPPPNFINFDKATFTGDYARDKANLLNNIGYVNQENLASAKNMAVRLLKRYVGQGGGSFHSSLYSYVNQVTASLAKIVENKDYITEFNESLTQLEVAYHKVANSYKNATKYVIPELKGDKKIDYKNLRDSLSLVTLENQNNAIQACDRFIIHHYGNKDGTVPASLQSLRKEIVKLFSSSNFDGKSEKTIKKVDELFEMLETTSNYKNNPSENAALKVFKIPDLPEDFKEAEQIFTKAMEQLNHYNRDQATQFATDYFSKYYTNNGLMSLEIIPHVSSITRLVESPEFDGKSLDFVKEIKDKFSDLNAKWESIKDLKEVPNPIQLIELTDDKNADFATLILSITDVVSETKKIALDNVQKFVKKYYKSADGQIDPKLHPIIIKITNTIKDPNFSYPINFKQKTEVEKYFVKLDEEYKQLMDPSNSVAAFTGFKITENWESDKKSLIAHTIYINKANKDKAREFYLKVLGANFSGSSGIIQTMVYSHVKMVLEYITNEDFKPKDYKTNEDKLNTLFGELEAKFASSNMDPESLGFIRPQLTSDRGENQLIIIKSIKMATKETKRGARTWVEQALKTLYGTSNGELDYRLLPIYDSFISLFDNDQGLNNMGNEVEEKFMELFRKMDDTFSKLNTIEGEKPEFPSMPISANMDNDFKGLTELLESANILNKEEAAKEFSRVLDYHLKDEDGSGDLRILPLLIDTLKIFERADFDGKSESIKKEFEAKLSELKEAYRSLNQNTKNIEPYRRIQYTNDFNADLESLVKSFNSVNKDNIDEAKKAVNIFLITFLGNSQGGGFNFSVSTLVADIKNLINEDNFNFHDKDQNDKFKSMVSDAFNVWSKQSSENSSIYTAPELTKSIKNDLDKLISSMNGADRSNNKEIISAVENFIRCHFNTDYRIYSTINTIINLISTPEFDFSLQSNQEKIRLYIIELSNAYEQIAKDNGAPKECPIPELSDSEEKDINLISTLFSNLDLTCKKKFANHLENFTKKHYSNGQGYVAATVVPHVSRLSIFIKSPDFVFNNSELKLEVMRKLSQIKEAAIQAEKTFITEKKFNAPQLASDPENNIETLTAEMGKLAKGSEASAKAYLLDYAKQIAKDKDGYVGLQFINVFKEFEDLLNSKNFSFGDPVQVSKIGDGLRKILAVANYSTTNPENSSPYAKFELSDDIKTDFEKLVKSFESANVQNQKDIDDFILQDFSSRHFKLDPNGPVPPEMIDSVVELKHLLSDSSFNYATRENLEKLRKLFEKLIMIKQGLENPELQPLPFYPPTPTGNLKEDKKNLYESFVQATLFNQLDVVKYIKYFLSVHYTENGKFAPTVQIIVDNLMSACSKPGLEFSNHEGAGVVKLHINDIERELKRLADVKANRPYYKAPALYQDREIDIQNLVASYKTVTDQTRHDAISFTSNFLNTMYAEPEGYFLPKIMEPVTAAFKIIQSKDFDFTKDEHVIKFQKTLNTLEKEYNKLKAPGGTEWPYTEPALSGTKYLDVVRLINSFNTINNSNKDKALNFILKYLRMHYGDKQSGTFESAEITNLVQKLYDLITPKDFKFDDFECVAKFQAILNELDAEINKLRDRKSDIKFEAFEFTKNKPYDTQKLLISLRNFAPKYKTNAISFLIKFLEFYYSQDGKWNDDLYNLANQITYTVSANNFNFDDPENINTIQSNLIQMDILKNKLESKPVKMAEFPTFSLSGDFEKDVRAFESTLDMVNNRNTPDAINMVMKIVKHYLTEKNGKFDSRIYSNVNMLSSKITTLDFDWWNNYEKKQIIYILQDTFKLRASILKPKPQQRWLPPKWTKDVEHDRDILFSGIKASDESFKLDINASILEFLNHHFKAKNGELPKSITDLFNEITNLIGQPGFSYKNEVKVSKLRDLFDKLANSHYSYNNPSIELVYENPGLTDNLDNDLERYVKSFEGMGKNSLPEIIEALNQLHQRYFKNSNGNFIQEVDDKYNQIIKLIQGDKFDFKEPKDIDNLNDSLKELVKFFESKSAEGPIEAQIDIPEFGKGLGLEVDKRKLLNYAEEAAFAFVSNIDIWQVVNSYLLAHFGDGTGDLAKPYKELQKKLYEKVKKASFDYSDPANINEVSKILAEFEKTQREINSGGATYLVYFPPKLTEDVKATKNAMFNSWARVNSKNRNDALKFLNLFFDKYYTINDPTGKAKLRPIRTKIYSLLGSENFNYSQPGTKDKMNQYFNELEEAHRELTGPIVLPFVEPELTNDIETDKSLLLSALKYASPKNIDAIGRFILKFANLHYVNISGDFSSEMNDLVFRLIGEVRNPNFKDDNSHITTIRIILMEMDELKENEAINMSNHDSYYNFDANTGLSDEDLWGW